MSVMAVGYLLLAAATAIYIMAVSIHREEITKDDPCNSTKSTSCVASNTHSNHAPKSTKHISVPMSIRPRSISRPKAISPVRPPSIIEPEYIIRAAPNNGLKSILLNGNKSTDDPTINHDSVNDEPSISGDLSISDDLSINDWASMKGLYKIRSNAS
jgi:hypothetical protein